MRITRDPTLAVNDKTHAERMVEVLEAKIEGRAIADIESYQVETRAVNKIPFKDLETSLMRWRRIVRWQKQGNAFRPIKVTFGEP